MIRFFEDGSVCHIIIDNSFNDNDNEAFSNLFDENYSSWHVEFTQVYIVSAYIVKFLYTEIFVNKKNVSITAHKSKLSRYFHRLGFKTISAFLPKQNVVDVQNIELVLIGGSADSSQKIINIVKNCSFENLTLVIVQHVEATKKGMLDEILQNYTNYKVSYATEADKIQKQRIYIAPNNKHLKAKDGRFVLSDDEKYNFSKPSVSLSYESFSNYYKDALLVIQECGYASDGVDKLKLLKENKSKIILQNKEECEAKPMVVNAFMEGSHDYIFKEKEIVDYINFVDKKPVEGECIGYLVEMIDKRFGYDFKLYHKDMIKRRLYAFMIKNRIKSIKNGVGAILFNRDVFKNFFLEISINVTEFFRDPSSFSDVKSLIGSSYKNKNNLKVWSAGCSNGKEAISMAVLLDNLNKLDKSIIYATDFNKVIIEEAKNGLYSLEAYAVAEKNLKNSALDILLDKYFLKNKNFVSVNDFIKEKILYFEHNLVTDSSFNEFDIIVCSNVIIYFDDTLQQKVFKLFYDSLKFGGYLILGESELIHDKYSSKFKRYNNETKIYRKVA